MVGWLEGHINLGLLSWLREGRNYSRNDESIIFGHLGEELEGACIK